MKRALTAYRLYLGLRLRSVARLFGALPVVAKMLFAAIAVAVGYGLHRAELPHEASVAGWAVGVFVAVGTGVCRIGRTELALLDELGIRPVFVFVDRCLLLSVPFFLLDAWAGLLAATVGTAVTTMLSCYRLRHLSAGGGSILRRLRFGGPLAAAYVWIAGYRSGALWAGLIGGALLLLALANGNADMAGVSIGVMVCAPALTVYYRHPDPSPFLRVYRSAAYLVRRKATEGALCTLIPIGWSLPLSVAAFPDRAGWLAGVAGLSVYVAMVLLYAAYAFYPHLLTSIVVAGALIMGSAVWLSVVPVGVAVASLAAILVGLHGLSIYNMKHFLWPTT